MQDRRVNEIFYKYQDVMCCHITKMIVLIYVEFSDIVKQTT